MNHAVVMAGGSGTRFWPESRSRRAKQFLNLTGHGTMIAETIRRFAPLFPPENIWVVAGEKDRDQISAGELGVLPGNLLFEPEGRNTAPAVAFAAAAIRLRDPEAVVVASPADHAIADLKGFRAVLKKALRLTRESGCFVTLGIPPTHPATGYGYIERGRPHGTGAFRVRRFAEKPDAATARRFLRSGRFDWNSGLFLFRMPEFRDRLLAHLPLVSREIDSAFGHAGKKSFPAALRKAYRAIPSVSVDHGLLEHEPEILVVPAAVGWNDIGTWRSLHDFMGKGEAGNVLFGDVIATDCRNVLVRSDRGVVALLGMENVVVVRSGDAVLVCPQDRSEEVKGIVDQVKLKYPGLA